MSRARLSYGVKYVARHFSGNQSAWVGVSPAVNESGFRPTVVNLGRLVDYTKEIMAHKSNKHSQRNRENYRNGKHLKKNKIRKITKALLTAGGDAVAKLKQRLLYWENH